MKPLMVLYFLKVPHTPAGNSAVSGDVARQMGALVRICGSGMPGWVVWELIQWLAGGMVGVGCLLS